ncbi:MAG: KpsF/GutQ family sugar-phosphate isomerase [Sedimentisphaerales bacterium]|nr:KpsF/GutQ family sugar-phosphate isomerase [Sedimentisphaerales bacterium]MBN2841445.1 KpsF/GutQ family sugar-phosphate isomerase [Sedimentisphaerales bacterium]
MTMSNQEIVANIVELISQEGRAVQAMASVVDQGYVQAVELMLNCKGNVIISGIGKAGIVGEKLSATLASTGTPSVFLHAAEAIHGDLGRVQDKDVVVVLSYSGSSGEIVKLIEHLKALSATIIAITGDRNSPLARHSDVTVWLGNITEACPLGLAPSTSTTCMMAAGDALALTVMKLRNFQAEDFARYHPGGALGRQLITVEQAAFFSRGRKLPIASDGCTVQQALSQAEKIVGTRHGCIMLVDANGQLTGLLTDGDLRRGLENKKQQLHDLPVAELMTHDPVVVRPETLASEAMAIFKKKRIDEIPVVDDKHHPVGLIDIQDVLSLKLND